MNAKGHVVTGLVGSAVVGLVDVGRRREDYTPESAGIVLGATALGSVVGSLLPDLLEPARSPNHRAFFHSLIAAGIVGIILRALWRRSGRPEAGEAFVRGIAIGYGAHLAADSITPKGLPLA